MKDKNGNKRKVSSRYISWLVASLLFITIFFLIMVFKCRIFDDYKSAEIIKLVNRNSNMQEITFLVDGEEHTVYYKEPVKVTLKVRLKVGDKIQYLVEDPNVYQLRRPTEIAILSCTEAFIVGTLIVITIYEIKKGF